MPNDKVDGFQGKVLAALTEVCDLLEEVKAKLDRLDEGRSPTESDTVAEHPRS